MKKSFSKLEFRNLSFGYDNNDFLKDISIEIPLGQIVSIKGKRGSGKSSIIRIMAGLSLPTKGEYLINDEVVSNYSFDEFLPFRLNIGFSFDYGGLLNNRTIFENLMLPITYHKTFDPINAEKWVMDLLDMFSLTEAAHKRPSDVSGGMRKEACVVRAFLQNPEMLLLDDPTTGMSSESQIILTSLIQEEMRLGVIKHVFIVSEDDHFLDSLAAKDMFIEANKIKVAA